MDRMQPPPNYYGAPYPSPQNAPMYPPQQGPGAFPPNYPPQQGMEPGMKFPAGTEMPVSPPDNTSIIEFYESFNKRIKTNLGKTVALYCSFGDSTAWHDKVFTGVLASAGEDHVILFMPEENKHVLIVGVYINYIEFYDKISMDIPLK